MVKRAGQEVSGGSVLPSPGLGDAPVLDLMCSHFVLTLAAKQGPKFNVRRDLNGLLSLAGRHLVWPAPVLARLREFLARRCKDNESWRRHEALAPREFLDRFGAWRGPEAGRIHGVWVASVVVLLGLDRLAARWPSADRLFRTPALPLAGLVLIGLAIDFWALE